MIKIPSKSELKRIESEDKHRSYQEEKLAEISEAPLITNEPTLEQQVISRLEAEGEVKDNEIVYQKTMRKVLEHQRDKRKKNYKEGPGQMSKDIGEGNLERAEHILNKIGGIGGYAALPRGEKKPIREAIWKVCKYKEERSVYNVLAEIRKRS